MAGKRVRDTDGRLEGIIASVAEGIISVDERFRIALFNPAAEKLFGRTAGEMAGQPLNVLIPERFRRQHDEHLRAFADTGDTARSMGQYGRIYAVRASGEEFALEATISQSGTPPDRRFTVILRDISERLRAEEEQRRLSEQLRLLSRRLFEAEERERRQLARELHDSVGQNVTALLLNLNMVRDLLPAEVRQSVKANLSDCETLLDATDKLIRNLMGNLRPPGLDELGLLAVLTEHARQVAARSGLAISVSGTEVAPRLPREAELALFRIAQEALVNAAKHSGAAEVTIALDADPGTVLLTIADNGRGFDPAQQLSRAGPNLGLVNMRERAEAVGGRLYFESGPGLGTRVGVRIPRTASSAGTQ